MESRTKKCLLIFALMLVIIPTGMYFASARGILTYDLDGQERQYRLFVPSSYDGESAVPLVVVLHGAFGNAGQIQRANGFDEVAEKEGFIVLYPDGLGNTQYWFHYWNSGHINPEFLNNVNDTHFIVSLVNEIQSQYSINNSRIYLTGHSNGGCMTYRVAATAPRLFAAIAPVSATIGGQMDPDSPEIIIPTPSSGINVTHFHGMEDINLKYDGGISDGPGSRGKRIDISVNRSIGFWVDVNNCSTTPSTESSVNGEITKATYVGTNANVTLVSMLHADHGWNHMSDAFTDENFMGGTLADAIWNSLKSSTL